MRAAAERNADLRAVAAAEHGFILQQKGSESEPCRRECGNGSGDAAAGDDQVVFAGIVDGGDPVFLPAELFQRGSAVRRDIIGIGGEIDRVAAPVESGEVVQGNGVRSGGKMQGPGFLPRPFFAVGAEDFRQFEAVDPKRETSGGSAAFPDGGPVPRSRPDVIDGGFDDFDFRHGVGDRRADSVRHQVRGTHFMHRGGVDHPAAGGAKRFRFKKQTAHKTSLPVVYQISRC